MRNSVSPNSYYVASVEFGNEIINGSGMTEISNWEINIGATPPPPPPPPQTFAVPGQVQASGYTAVAGTLKLEPCSDTGGGQDLGYTSVGGTVQYAVSVAAGGSFNATYRVASDTGGSFDVLIDGNKVDTITAPNTGGWQNWTTISGNGSYAIAAGNHTLQLTVDAVAYNLNWIDFSSSSCALPGGSYGGSCTGCSAGTTSSGGCALTCASCTEENGSQNANPSLPLPCASAWNENGVLVCDSPSCVLPGGSYAASCTACSAGATPAGGCALTCASCTEENGSQNANPGLPLPCATASNNNGVLVCD